MKDAVDAYVKLIRTAEALHSEVSRGLADEGLTASQFSTLKVLRLQGALAQKDIASHLLKTGGNVTLVVDNLERAGLVARERVPGDRRVTRVRITSAGEELFDRAYPPHLRRIETAMQGLGDAGLAELERLLDKLGVTEAAPVCCSA
jgi:MarR family 2-MHQ and catechol resistance regulon transcriptional repressor